MGVTRYLYLVPSYPVNYISVKKLAYSKHLVVSDVTMLRKHCCCDAETSDVGKDRRDHTFDSEGEMSVCSSQLETIVH